MSGYWDATQRIIEANGGQNPVCSICGQTMYPIDDHGRFMCGCPSLEDALRSVWEKHQSQASPQGK